jgi:outer membrane protein OmpA-like peptidoglycan-associated protein
MKHTGFPHTFAVAAIILAVALPQIGFADDMELPWHISVGGGWKDLEGDEEVDDSGFVSCTFSYDYSEPITFELGLTYFPFLAGGERDIWSSDGTTKIGTVNRLEEKAGVSSTMAAGISLEVLYHVARWDNFEPYLVGGAGCMYYFDDFGHGGIDPTLNAGAGFLWHFDREWAVRADMRTFLAGISAVEANSLINVGIVWTPGVEQLPPTNAVWGIRDDDADGLTNDEEIDEYGTDPQDEDSDDDGLDDFAEVKEWFTNPWAEDTDFDGLIDGAEVYEFRTNPREADTDKGGVSDGHEVIDDGTDPLDGSDDLLLYRLNIEFDTDKADIKPAYHRDLDIIGKVLRREPNSTAKIEGHADKRARSSRAHNQKLSERRALAVLDYLADRWNIDEDRMTAVGYGFDRPIAPNDDIEGNPRNRRVDVYIEGSEEGVGGEFGLDREPEPDEDFAPDFDDLPPEKGRAETPEPEKGRPETPPPEKGRPVVEPLYPEKGAAD